MADKKLDPHEREALKRRIADLESQLAELPRKQLSAVARALKGLELSADLKAALLTLGDE